MNPSERLVAVLRAHRLERWDRRAWWCSCGADCMTVEDGHAEHVADEIVKALGLIEVTALQAVWMGVDSLAEVAERRPFIRLVSDWHPSDSPLAAPLPDSHAVHPERPRDVDFGDTGSESV